MTTTKKPETKHTPDVQIVAEPWMGNVKPWRAKVTIDGKLVGYSGACKSESAAIRAGQRIARAAIPQTPADLMALPDGKTCGDCDHWRRCESLGFSDSPQNKRCDFSPSRFQATASARGEE